VPNYVSILVFDKCGDALARTLDPIEHNLLSPGFAQLPRPADDVWAAQAKQMHFDSILHAVMQLPWTEPQSLVILASSEDDNGYGLWMLVDDEWTEVPLSGWHRTDGSLRHL
jgi:hypothetical protein